MGALSFSRERIIAEERASRDEQMRRLVSVKRQEQIMQRAVVFSSLLSKRTSGTVTENTPQRPTDEEEGETLWELQLPSFF